MFTQADLVQVLRRSAAFLAVLLWSALAPNPAESGGPIPLPGLPFAPAHYVCHRAPEPPVIDGRIDDGVWQDAAWTADFVDIQGSLKPKPRLRTRVKMLWDQDYLYFAAEMEEPDVWAKLTARDAVIYYDNDFEVFLDPNGDTHEYYELEINAFGTEWDLFLTRPYLADGAALHAWDIHGLKTAVQVDGTLNTPGDTDAGWTVEIAMPWGPLAEAARTACPPETGDQWRFNFSRVQWKTEVREGDYVKVTDPETGAPLPEDNWVWSPQGLINMHYPERWGLVQFARKKNEDAAVAFVVPDDLQARAALFDLYYAERNHEAKKGKYTADLGELTRLLSPDPTRLEGFVWPPLIRAGSGFFHATLGHPDGRVLRINHEGRLDVMDNKP